MQREFLNVSLQETTIKKIGDIVILEVEKTLGMKSNFKKIIVNERGNYGKANWDSIFETTNCKEHYLENTVYDYADARYYTDWLREI